MKARAIGAALGAWALATCLACAFVHRAFSLRAESVPARPVIASVWDTGALIARAFLARAGETDPTLDAAMAARPSATLVYETIVGESPVLDATEITLSLSFAPGRDGVMATLGGRTEIVTPDDLLSVQAYDRGTFVPVLASSIGVDVPFLLARLSDRFGIPAADVIHRAELSRVRVVRSLPGGPRVHRVTAQTMTIADARQGALDAARYLARGVDAEGRFRYLVDAPSDRDLPGYDWPRHAGATMYLAQVAGLTKDPEIGWAALRAAAQLRDKATVACGPDACIGGDPIVDVGSTALTVLAFIEVVRSDLDAGYALPIPKLTGFLRAQQRSDGELEHLYDRGSQRPIDTQLLYYTGEAALALSRANALLGDPRDLQAASRALAHLVGPGWSFLGSRYYFGEEHWTCIAMDDLWDRAPDSRALDFCLRWHAYGRRLQYAEGDTALDADGMYGFGPVLSPRLTPVGSRTEAAIATLDAARRAGVGTSDLDELRDQIRRSLAILLRHQLGDATAHLMTDPAAVRGAMPASEVDWQLRIDFAQHTGSALLRWLALSRASNDEADFR